MILKVAQSKKATSVEGGVLKQRFKRVKSKRKSNAGNVAQISVPEDSTNGHIIAAAVSLCESRASCVWFYATYAFSVYHNIGIDFVLFVPRLGHQQAAAS